jgi:hypothetical protein
MNTKKILAFSAILAFNGLLASVTPALGEEVTFTTLGYFTAAGSNVLSEKTGNKIATLTFDGNLDGDDITSSPGQVPATVDSLGTFVVSVPPGTSLVGKNEGVFAMRITQLDPPGTGNLGADLLYGNISNGGGSTGSLIITFQSTSVTINQITYTLEDLGQNGLQPNQLGIGKNGAQLEASITSPMPEPPLFGLTGLGFFGLAATAMRRYKRRGNAASLQFPRVDC